MNNPNHRGGVTFQQVFQWLSREGWFSQWGMSGMSYFKPGTMVGNAVYNQNVFVGEANAEMYWRHSGDWQRVERIIYQTQLNNQMQNQMNQQRQHNMQMNGGLVRSMNQSIPSTQQSLPSTAELMDQRSRSLNYPLDMLCDILAVDRDAQPDHRMRQQRNVHQMLGDPSRFPVVMDPHAASAMPHPNMMFQQAMSMNPQSLHSLTQPSHEVVRMTSQSIPAQSNASILAHDMGLPVSSSTHDIQTSLSRDDRHKNAPDTSSTILDTMPASDSSNSTTQAPSTSKKASARPKRRSRNLYIRLDQMKTVLRKHGWKWVEGPLGFIYCKPHVEVSNKGKSMSGKEGIDYFSGRAPFEAYVRSQRSLMELIQNELKEKHDGAIFSMDIPPEDQLCAPTYKERTEAARRQQLKAKRIAALELRRSQMQVLSEASSQVIQSDSTQSCESSNNLPTSSQSTESVQVNSTDSVPFESAPTDARPAVSLSLDSLPTESLPTESLPTESLPATSLPTTPLPATSLPTTPLPTTSLPTTSLPTASLPSMPLPNKSLPTESLSSDSLPTELLPTDPTETLDKESTLTVVSPIEPLHTDTEPLQSEPLPRPPQTTESLPSNESSIPLAPPRIEA